MTTYREEKDKQLAILVELKSINAKLKELRPIVAVKPKVTAAHEAFKIEKEKQANTLKELKAANTLLAELRGSKAPKVKDTSAAKAARDAVKEVKAEERAKKQIAKEINKRIIDQTKAAEKQKTRLEREARREARAEELESQGRSSKGYTVPLLSDKEREATILTNKILAALGKENAEEHEHRRQVHVAKLLEE